MEGLPAALSVAGHAGSTGGLALPAMVLTDITRLVKRQRRSEQGDKETQKQSQSLPLYL